MKTEIKGTELIVTLDLSKQGETSKSGKSTILESTRGFLSITNEISLSLNLIKKK